MIEITRSQSRPSGFQLQAELLVVEPREEVFAFFADAWQLEAITPPWLHFSVITPRPLDMQPETVIDYRLRLHGLPIRWRSLISLWEPPYQFVDEQVHGPYRRWHHLHTFEEVEGGTLVRDVVNYQVPFGIFTHALLVKRDLTKIFQFRQDTLCRIFTPVDESVRPAGESLPAHSSTSSAHS